MCARGMKKFLVNGEESPKRLERLGFLKTGIILYYFKRLQAMVKVRNGLDMVRI